MNRRRFIKNTCISCFAIGAGIEMLNLESCASLPIIKANQDKNLIAIDPAVFAQSNIAIVRPPNMEYDILLVKQAPDSYKALLMQCTHRDVALNANNSNIFCTAHGSKFDLQGNVTEGPATQALKQYKVTTNNNKITIQLN